MVVGDLNGRIGDHGSKRQLRNRNLKEMRRTKDKLLNKNGEDLIEFVRETNLDVINGSPKGDEEKEVTFINKNCQSLIA